MRQERTRPNGVLRAGGPEAVWRCPTCFQPFFSRYAVKRHDGVACEPPRQSAKAGRAVAQGAAR